MTMYASHDHLDPVQNANSHPDELHRPHAQPEPQGAAQTRQEGGDRELWDVGLSHLHLLLQGKAEASVITPEAVNNPCSNLKDFLLTAFVFIG